MILLDKLNYKKEKIRRADGTSFNLVEVEVNGNSKVEFQRANTDNLKAKLFDIGHLRLLKAYERGIKKPVVIVWAGYSHGKSATDYFPDVFPGDKQIYLSLNAWIKTQLQYLIKTKNYYIKAGELFVKEINSKEDQQASQVLTILKEEARLEVFSTDEELSREEVYENLDYRRDLVGVGQIAYPSLYCREHQYPLGFNTSYFLLEEADWESKYSLLGDPYGLQITQGKIVRPPIYSRSALLQDDKGNWEIKNPSLNQLILTYQNQSWDLSQFSLNSSADKSIYTRYYGIKEKGIPLKKTPQAVGKIEIVIIDTYIVAIHKGGDSQIPQNGFVLSLPAAGFNFNGPDYSEVGYKFKDNKKYLTAIQTGPVLVDKKKLVLGDQSLKNEQFYGQNSQERRPQFGRVVPTDYASDIDQTRAARLLVGITSDNKLRLLAVESVNSGMEFEGESTGATLLEMAELARLRKYKYALNMDGGGSTNIQYLYGDLLKTADRRGLPGVVYERMVPVLGVLTK